MKLPLEMVQDLVLELVGDDAVELVTLIKDKQNVSEFKIADKMEITVNKVRNILYRLSEYNLVDFTRKKDKKKGMYIYYWTFINKIALELIIKLKKEKLSKLRQLQQTEKFATYFKCPEGCIDTEYDKALEHDFKCPECNSLLEQVKSKYTPEMIKEEMKKLREDLNSKILQQPLIPVVEEPKKKVVKKKAVKKKPAKKKIVKKKTVKKKVKKPVKKKAVKKKVVKKKPAKKIVKKKAARKKAAKKKVVKRKTVRKPAKKKATKRKAVSKPKKTTKKKGILKKIFKR